MRLCLRRCASPADPRLTWPPARSACATLVLAFAPGPPHGRGGGPAGAGEDTAPGAPGLSLTCSSPGRSADAPGLSHLLQSSVSCQAADVPGTKLAVVAVVRVCFQCKAWAALNENVLLLSKRRAQLKQARPGAVCVVLLSCSPLPGSCAGHRRGGAGVHDFLERHARPGHQGGADQHAGQRVRGQGAPQNRHRPCPAG